MRLLSYILLFFSCVMYGDISVDRLREYCPEKMYHIVESLLRSYAITLDELDRCIEINEQLLIEHENDIDFVQSTTQELLHYMRCKFMIMSMMRKFHHLCLWIDSDRFKEFAAEMLEIYDKEFGIG